MISHRFSTLIFTLLFSSHSDSTFTQPFNDNTPLGEMCRFSTCDLFSNKILQQFCSDQSKIWRMVVLYFLLPHFSSFRNTPSWCVYCIWTFKFNVQSRNFNHHILDISPHYVTKIDSPPCLFFWLLYFCTHIYFSSSTVSSPRSYLQAKNFISDAQTDLYTYNY